MNTTSRSKTANDRSLYLQAFDLLRFPLAIAVVIHHCFPVHTQAVGYSISNDILLFMDVFVKGYSVPIFFFISGYLFFYNTEFSKDIYIRKIKTRVKTLLIPYLVWNTLAIISLLVANSPGIVMHPEQLNITIPGLFSAYWAYDHSLFTTTMGASIYHPIDRPLYFVRDLMVAVLCSPVIYGLIKRFKYYPVILFGLIWLGGGISGVIDTSRVSCPFFFLWGAYLSINKKEPVLVFGRFFKSSMILFPSLGLLCMLSSYFYPDVQEAIKHVNVVVSVLFTYNLAVWLLEKGYCKVNVFLVSVSFFVYVSHTIVQEQIKFVHYLIFRFIVRDPTIEEVCILNNYNLKFVLIIVIILTVYWLLKRYAPSLLRVLNGSR